jgi:hypothetical protein
MKTISAISKSREREFWHGKSNKGKATFYSGEIHVGQRFFWEKGNLRAQEEVAVLEIGDRDDDSDGYTIRTINPSTKKVNVNSEDRFREACKQGPEANDFTAAMMAALADHAKDA